MWRLASRPRRFFEDGDEQSRHGDPDLGLHGVLAETIEGLDARVLLDSLQVEPCDGQRLQPLAGGGIVETHASGGVRINPRRCGRVQDDRVVGEHGLGQGGGARAAPVQPNILLLTLDRKAEMSTNHVEPGEVEVAAIHHARTSPPRARFHKRVDIVGRPAVTCTNVGMEQRRRWLRRSASRASWT